jgi:hypothetical protein
MATRLRLRRSSRCEGVKLSYREQGEFLVRGAGCWASLSPAPRAAERIAELRTAKRERRDKERRDKERRNMSDSIVFAASLLYFVPITVVIAATSLAAFGRELLPRLQVQRADKAASQPGSKQS